MGDSYKQIIYYIQTTLYDGRQPDDNGFYCYTRKELAEKTGLSPTTVNRNIDDVLEYFGEWCDLSVWAKYKEYAGEILYTDVSYERGVFRFRRNPITRKPELSFLWGLPPLWHYFVYDGFDEKHRRRTNSGEMMYDAIPWTWDADQYEEELKQAREAIRRHQSGVKE